jgi:hypothetical protein
MMIFGWELSGLVALATIVFWKDVLRYGGVVQSLVFFDHFTTLIPRLRARLMVVLLYEP